MGTFFLQADALAQDWPALKPTHGSLVPYVHLSKQELLVVEDFPLVFLGPSLSLSLDPFLLSPSLVVGLLELVGFVGVDWCCWWPLYFHGLMALLQLLLPLLNLQRDQYQPLTHHFHTQIQLCLLLCS